MGALFSIPDGGYIELMDNVDCSGVALQLASASGNLKLEIVFWGVGGLLSNLFGLGGRLPLTLWEVDGALRVF